MLYRRLSVRIALTILTLTIAGATGCATLPAWVPFHDRLVGNHSKTGAKAHAADRSAKSKGGKPGASGAKSATNAADSNTDTGTAPFAPGPQPCRTGNGMARARLVSSKSVNLGSPGDVAVKKVTFTSLGDKLTGVVEYPKNAGRRRLPGVVIVHDMGPMNRDGLVHGALGLKLPIDVAIYAELGHFLAARGYVVLRYDKRSCVRGSVPGCNYPRSFVTKHRDDLASALVDDARAATQVLLHRKDVNPRRISIIGHGQGADVALALVSQGVKVHSLVLLAPSPVGLDKIVLHQTKFSIDQLQQRAKQAGNSALGDRLRKQITALQKAETGQEQAFAQLRQGDAPAKILGLPAKAWQGFLKLHRQAMRRLKHHAPPILAIFGGLDLNLPKNSARKFARIMGENRFHRVQIFQDLTHPMVDLGDQEDVTHISRDVEMAVGQFLAH